MPSLADLLAAARTGEAAARDALVRRCLPRVTSLVHAQLRRRLRPAQHAVLRLLSTGDVVQDVLVEVLRGLDRWDATSDEAFASLLATLVEHRLVDQVRRSQADRRDVRRHDDGGPLTHGVADAGEGPATAAAGNEQVALYRDALATFGERERALLALRLEEDVEFAVLAERLAYPSADAARKAFHRAQARLLLELRQRGLVVPGNAP